MSLILSYYFDDGLVPTISVEKIRMELDVWVLANKTNTSTVGGTCIVGRIGFLHM